MPGGRPREVHEDDEDRVCRKHGLTPHRLHDNGRTKEGRWCSAWRCLECLRARYKPKG